MVSGAQPASYSQVTPSRTWSRRQNITPWRFEPNVVTNPLSWKIITPVRTPAGYKYIASSYTSYSTPSLWRWNWHRVPKRRPTTIWRWGNTQKNIYNIQITAKVWNQERTLNIPQVNARVFCKCAVHLSPILVPHGATTSLSICNWLKEMVNEECGNSRLRRWYWAVSCRW